MPGAGWIDGMELAVRTIGDRSWNGIHARNRDLIRGHASARTRPASPPAAMPTSTPEDEATAWEPTAPTIAAPTTATSTSRANRIVRKRYPCGGNRSACVRSVGFEVRQLLVGRTGGHRCD